MLLKDQVDEGKQHTVYHRLRHNTAPLDPLGLLGGGGQEEEEYSQIGPASI